MLKILVADDHAIVRRGLKQILAETDDISSIDEAEDVGAHLNSSLFAQKSSPFHLHDFAHEI